MRDTSSLTPREKIARLRKAFLDQLPARLSQARDLLDRVNAAPADHGTLSEMHRLLHNFKGTGASFGFRELSEAVARAERLVAGLLDASAAPPVDWRHRLAEAVAAMDGEARTVCTAGCLDNCRDLQGFTLITEPPQGTTAGGGRLVYICDDDTLLLERLSCQLGCFGYETVPFADPGALRERIRTRRPDALILDIHFPEGESAGIELRLSLDRELGGEPIPTIFLSGRGDFAARMAAVQAGGGAYFLKPAPVSELVAALDQLTRQQQAAPYRVLIVDDEPEVAGYHAILLQEAGMTTYQLDDPSRVLEVLREFMPDMVLMDIYMPGCDGLALSRLIRQVPSLVGLPIVYLSSEPDRQKQFSAMRTGADGFLTKPVVPGELVATVGILAERMRILRSLMARDSLTGLFNHTTTTHFLERTLAASQRTHSPLCFVMIDLDRFKRVNDTHGHLVGDQVLMALSRMLRQRLRTADVVGRYGGEEFAAILPDTPGRDAARCIDGLRESFARVAFHSATGSFGCTFSAGIAVSCDGSSLESLRESADRALYAAKRGGRNRVVVVDDAAGSGNAACPI